MTSDAVLKEPEGIFPDNEHVLVECDIQSARIGKPAGLYGWPIDLYKLKLDGTGKDFQRVTYFSDYKGYNASNPVVATNAKFFIFQIAFTNDVGAFTGAGHGLIINWLNKF